MAVGLLDPFAFSAGAATFFAPCAFPLLPGYVSYYIGKSGDGRTDGGTAGRVEHRLASLTPQHAARITSVLQAAVVGLVVSLGFFAVYGVLAGVIVLFGSQLLGSFTLLELVVGTIMIAAGGAMLAGIDLSVAHVALPERRRSVSGFFAFGVLYATAAAGCTAGVFVGVAAGSLSRGPIAGFGTMAAYALGMSVVMIGVTVSAALGRDLLVRRLAANTGTIQRVAGGLLLVAGVYQIYLFLFEFGGREMLGL